MKIFVEFAIVSKIFQYLSFSEFNDHYWPTKLFLSRRWVTWQNFRYKNSFELFFTAKLKTFVFNFAVLIFFMIFFNKSRKLEVAELNPIMESIPISLSLSVD